MNRRAGYFVNIILQLMGHSPPGFAAYLNRVESTRTAAWDAVADGPLRRLSALALHAVNDSMARLFCCEDIPGVFSGILTGPVLYALIDGQGVDVSQWLLDCLCGRLNEVVAPPLEGKISAERKATAERRLVAMGTVCSAIYIFRR